MRRDVVGTVLIVVCLAACHQGDPDKCEQAVRNYATLEYWKRADVLIAKAPPAQREALRKQKLAEFTTKMENGVQTLVTQCVSANDKDTIDCMIAAKTADDAEKCAPVASTK
ncbi:MAG: hypothetical protein ABI467_29615 [Kofleriaceae bacterium]